MSRRFSPRTLNFRTNASDTESFDLAFDDGEGWSTSSDSDENLFDDQDDDSDDFDDGLTETAYDDDWEHYWRDRRLAEQAS